MIDRYFTAALTLALGFLEHVHGKGWIRPKQAG